MRDLRLHALLALLAMNQGARIVHESEVAPPMPKPPTFPPMPTSQRNDAMRRIADTIPRYRWPADRDRDGASSAYLAAEAKRARKNAKRLRDAQRARGASIA